jgi:23S rRNA pseudouridine1911/1915/1917 synthase
MKNFVVKASEAGERLDKVISIRFKEFSRVVWQEQIKSGQVLVNNNPVDPRHIVLQDDHIKYEIPQKTHNLPPTNYKLPILDIIFENDSVIVINKPAGIITHPAHANTEDSVVHRILAHDQKIAKAVYDPNSEISNMRPGIVHRLDKDTSGVMIVAKTKEAMTHLAKQIQEKRAQKTYIALLFGHLAQDDITVHNWLNRDLHDRRKVAVTTPEQACPQRQQEADLRGERGREAETFFHIVSLLTNHKGDKITLVEAKPITGRTHQIRVHAAHLGHPVLGDTMYYTHESKLLSERLGIKRQLLHAKTLAIRLPKEANKTTFNAEIPDDINNILKDFK